MYYQFKIGEQLAQYLEDGGMDSLCDKFAFKGFIGDQVSQQFAICADVDVSFLAPSRAQDVTMSFRPSMFLSGTNFS